MRLMESGHGALAARLFGPGLVALLIKVATAGLSYLMFVVLARLLSHAEYGKFAFSFNLGISLAAVAGLGATTAILRFWPQYTVTGRPDLARGALTAGTRWTLYASLAAGVAIAGLSPLAASLFQDGTAAHLAMAGLLVPAFALSEYAAAALRAHGITFWSLAPRDVVWRGGVPALAAVVAWRGGSMDAAQALLLAAGLLMAITALQALYALRVFDLRGPVATDWAAWRRAAAPMWGSAVLYALVQQFDVVISGLFLTPAETGAYFAAQKTASLLGLLLIAGNLVSAPMISAQYHAGDHKGLRQLCALMAAGIAVPTIAGFGVMALAGPQLLSIFDPSFTAAYPILLILAAGATFDAAAGNTGYFLQMSGNERSYLKIMAITYVGVVALQVLLAPRWGAFGIAIPTALGVIVWNAWAVVVLRRATGIDPSAVGALHYFLGRRRGEPS
jgi:O-antigen/teichoic acid export membrane protein